MISSGEVVVVVSAAALSQCLLPPQAHRTMYDPLFRLLYVNRPLVHLLLCYLLMGWVNSLYFNATTVYSVCTQMQSLDVCSRLLYHGGARWCSLWKGVSLPHNYNILGLRLHIHYDVVLKVIIHIFLPVCKCIFLNSTRSSYNSQVRGWFSGNFCYLYSVLELKSYSCFNRLVISKHSGRYNRGTHDGAQIPV